MKQIWKIDPTHSEIVFKVKHMMISTVSGNLTDYDATVTTDGDDFKNAEIEFTAQVNSLTTGNEGRDNHLKSADFFDADNHPQIIFKSKSFDGNKLTGDLTIRDVTKEVVLDVDFNGVAIDPYGQTKAGFEVSGAINRKEYHLNWNAVTEAGSIVVSDQVKIQANVQFIKQ